jgi:hypothetical protein
MNTYEKYALDSILDLVGGWQAAGRNGFCLPVIRGDLLTSLEALADSRKASDVVIGKKYRITYQGSYSGRIATAIRISSMGDVTLQFKNKSEVTYHAGWLRPV